jgi:hypothetical protein
MKKEKQPKLNLGKVTIQDLDYVLDGDEEKTVKGGSRTGTTEIIIFC